MEEKPPFCSNCRWQSGEFCSRPMGRESDVVSGGLKVLYCSHERDVTRQWGIFCGWEGKYFQPKQPKGWAKFLAWLRG